MNIPYEFGYLQQDPSEATHGTEMKAAGKGFALITGASRGIGKGFAKECACMGYDLALVSLDGDGLPELAAELVGRFKVAVKTLETDLADADAANVVMDWVETEGLQITLLVNNAGLGSVGPFDATDQRKHAAMLTLNMQTPYFLMRRLMPMLQQQDQAYVINISSQAAFYPIPFKATYSASKSFLMYLSLSTEYELRGSNVHVCVVCPSGVKTSPAIRERIESAGLLSRLVALEPEDVAKISLRNALKKRRLIIPGTLNRMSYYATLMLPDFVKMAFIASKLKKNQFDTPEPSYQQNLGTPISNG
ncbi:MAG: hypothetical protein RLZZ165_1543 [Bacteroidota bacterium]